MGTLKTLFFVFCYVHTVLLFSKVYLPVTCSTLMPGSMWQRADAARMLYENCREPTSSTHRSNNCKIKEENVYPSSLNWNKLSVIKHYLSSFQTLLFHSPFARPEETPLKHIWVLCFKLNKTSKIEFKMSVLAHNLFEVGLGIVEQNMYIIFLIQFCSVEQKKNYT